MKVRKKSAKRKVARRSNVERTATTRAKLISACITSLIKVGHAATTTTLVSRMARVTRGAMLHHFPSRAALLLATAEHIEERQNDLRNARLLSLPPAERPFAVSDLSWELQSQPEAAALLEIVVATLSDRKLRMSFDRFLQRRAELRRENAIRIAQDLGVSDPSKIHDLVRLHVACLWGLSIELMFSHDHDEVERARLLFRQLERELGGRLAKGAQQSKQAEVE